MNIGWRPRQNETHRSRRTEKESACNPRLQWLKQQAVCMLGHVGIGEGPWPTLPGDAV